MSHLTERISGVGEDGQPRVFRDSAVGNLHEFFDRFRSLNVRSNDQLDALVAEAQRAVRGSEPRTSATAAGSARPWPPSSRGSSRRSTRCSSSGPGAASSGSRPGREARDGPRRRPRRAGQDDLFRGDPPGDPRPAEDRPRQRRRARRRRPLARRPAAPARAGARPVRLPERGPGGRGRLARASTGSCPAA